MTASGARPGLWLYAGGLGLLLVGSVLPWLVEEGVPIWAWDVSALWTVTGRIELLQTPPSVGAVVFVVAFGLALPLMLRRTVPATISAGLAGLVAALVGITLARALLLDSPVPPHAGLVASLVAVILVAVGALVEAGE